MKYGVKSHSAVVIIFRLTQRRMCFNFSSFSLGGESNPVAKSVRGEGVRQYGIGNGIPLPIPLVFFLKKRWNGAISWN